MCGIAGILYAQPERPVAPGLLKAMADSLAHRGPDAEGFWSAGGVGLAHRRLSIIDLAGGDQPIGNEDGSIQVVFNGEIYNFRALRQELQTRGHCFRTESDTEVLVHLYEEHGERLVEKLRGMFAFALWDQAKRRLLLARDRVGLKPLYVYRDGEKLLFASEIKAILAAGQIDRELDCAALEDYLALGFVPGRRSIFRRMEKLPPAHVLTVAAGDLQREPRRYWSYPPADPPQEERSLEEWCEAVETKIGETVAAHEIADVPVGALLSGGLDSSAILAELCRDGRAGVQAFSIGLEDERRSELPYARLVARQFGCRHVEQVVTADAAASLADLVHHFDEPFADSSAIPTLLVSRIAREHVKVVLSGDGGDEAFGGYSRYAHDLREARLRGLLPAWLRSNVVGPLARIWPKADWLPRVLRAKSLLTNLSLPPDEAYAATLSLARPPLRRQLLSGDVRAALDGHAVERAVVEPFRAAGGRDPLAAMIAADINLLLPDDFLTKVDRASMACGLEVRPPLVDHELLELTARMPSELKVRRGQTKWILKRIYQQRLPGEVVHRPKQGFEMPTDDWLRGPLREMFEDTVFAPGSPVAPLIDRSTVRRLYNAHRARVGRHGNVLWSLLVLAQWAERYLGDKMMIAD